MFIVAPTLTAALPDGVTKERSLEGITEYHLENGLKILLFPDQTKETITVNITYLVGSKNENYGETGMAHLLEHLVFKGTPKHPNIPQELTEHGARPNGTTWTDRTNYYETFNATDENLNWALDMEADRMINSFIAKKDLDSEMTVVRNEMERGENSPFRITMQRLMSTAYMWHNYGKSTIGARSDVENVDIKNLQAFYRKYYQPDNAVLIVAGKIDEEKTLGLVNKYFAPIPRPKRVLPKLYTEEPVQDGEREVTVRRVGDIQLVGAGYHVPAGSHPDFAAVEVLTRVLGATPTGRLHKALVETGKASGTLGNAFQWEQPGYAMFGATVPKDGNLGEARATLIDTTQGIGKSPVTDEEVNRAKQAILKNTEQSFNTSERFALSLSEWIGMGDWRLFFLHRDRVEKVTTAQVNEVAKRYLKTANRTVGQFIPVEKPDRTEIPESISVAEMLKDYKGREAVAQGEAFDPSPENIAKSTIHEKIGNVKIAMLPKKTRGESVRASMNLKFGDEKNLNGKAKIAESTARMLMRGTKSHTRAELTDAFNKLKSSVNVNGSAEGVTISIQSDRTNLPAAMALVAEVLREPVFPQEELDQLIKQRKSQLEQGRTDPQQIAFRELSRVTDVFSLGHPRYAYSLDEELAAIEKVNRKSIQKFHKEFFGFSQGAVAIIGDFDPASTKAQLKKLFSNWDSKANFAKIEEKHQDQELVRLNFDTPDKANAVFMAVQPFSLTDDHNDYPALALGGFMLGGGFLNSRLATRLRQKEGLSYTVFAFVRADSENDRAALGSFAICAPENLEKLEASYKDEINKLFADGFTEEEVKAAKSGYLQQAHVNRSQDQRLIGNLRRYTDIGRPFTWQANFEEKVEALTADQINAAFKRHLKSDGFSIVRAGDLSKAAEPQN